MFDIGQRVVCIVEDPWIYVSSGEPCTGANPIKGGVYTICGIERALIVIDSTAVDLWLELDGLYGQYEASAFRPVRDTDISVFTDLLAPTPKELEPA